MLSEGNTFSVQRPRENSTSRCVRGDIAYSILSQNDVKNKFSILNPFQITLERNSNLRRLKFEL